MNEKLKQLAAWVEPEKHEKFAKIAEKNNRTISGELGMLINRHIEENHRGKKKTK